ncbi:tyrosine phosphatase family protein [Aspergillus glaucus CBS 516.65]|uniref:Tyrosine specific protein phosphatases domain-containing protein n=1 Tax=Aspergillus glaucus CBS 516.65 TaxID=1160497 RepID=A0A1L9VT51_ASPGL|nr:hypothetical protein ASPGLDRAFT_1508822 [Aspergillus glaucus CBS 516.65]OJJ87074.1 hypothetical protein ASPGLDRAFT_1508822 [Aspergillus glaucus CBS 516.65]
MASHRLDNQSHVFPNSQVDLPDKFAEVMSGIYRSSFPQAHHLPAMKKFGLKTIVTLVDEPYSPAHEAFLREGNITHHRILVQPNKELIPRSPDSVIARVLEILVNRNNQPVLVHCNKGKHRTGCVISCLRKLQGWSLDTIIPEYLSFSHPKSRLLDEKFIEEFDVSKFTHLSHTLRTPPWPLPASPKLCLDNDEDCPSPTKWYLQPSVSRVNAF